MDDMALLREYATSDSEAAFETLVSRRVGFVYSAALRQVSDPHLAEEVTQAVFIILAQKAGRISGGGWLRRPRRSENEDRRRGVAATNLIGWLFKTTRFAALAQIRAAAKRRRHEQEAQMQSELQPTAPDLFWEQMSPLLDEALATLGETDRQAVLLRYFENKSMAEVGSSLGTREDTARKRVNRALEKLHRYYSKRGVSSTTAIIAGAISANSVQAAPAALAKSVTAVAMTKGAVASGSTLTLIKGALKIMAWTKMKMAIVGGVVVLLAAGTTTVTLKEIQEHKTYSWDTTQASFDVLYKTPPQVAIVASTFPTNAPHFQVEEQTKENIKVLGIAASVKDIVCAAYQAEPSRTVFLTELPQGKYDFIANLPQGSAEALQQKIRKNFGLAGRLETRESEVLLLTLRNPSAQGFKVATNTTKSPNRGIRGGAGQRTWFSQPIFPLTRFLESRFETPVIDRTGLKNKYDFALKWDEPDWHNPNNNGLKQVLLDQLGLELVPGREPIEMLVMEKVK